MSRSDLLDAILENAANSPGQGDTTFLIDGRSHEGIAYTVEDQESADAHNIYAQLRESTTCN